MKTITLATFNTPAQAEPLRHRLEKAHITTSIREGGILKRLWFVDGSKARVKLDVDEGDLRESRRLLSEFNAEKKPIPRMVRCPECHSSRVEFPQFTRKFFLPNLIGLLSGLGLVEKKYYCEDCHCTWSPRGQKKKDHRKHLAPDYFLEGIPEKSKK